MTRSRMFESPRLRRRRAWLERLAAGVMVVSAAGALAWAIMSNL
jgi:hypothetical protein